GVALAAHGVRVGEDGHRVVLRRGAGGVEVLEATALDAGQGLRRGLVTAAGVVVGAGGQADRRQGGEPEQGTGALEVHRISLVHPAGSPPGWCVATTSRRRI